MGKSINKFKLKKDLNQIAFKGLENYKNGTANAVFIQLIDEKKALIKVFKHLIAQLFFCSPKYGLHKKENDNLLFFFSQSYVTRKDHFYTFEKFIKKIENGASYIVESNNAKRKISISSVKEIKYAFCWMHQMKDINLHFLNKLQLVANMIEVKKFLDEVKKEIDVTVFDLLVTFCDAYLIDNYFTQYCNQKGLITATLQHGQFLESNEEEDFFSSGFEGFASDYFLAWGEYTKKQAVKSGIQDEKIVCVGVPQYVDDEIKEQKNSNRFGRFCVILDGNDYSKDNDQMVKVVDHFAKKTNLEYSIKLHPAAIKKDYANEINSNNFIGYISIECRIKDLIRKYDFFIVSNSSVLTELVYFHQIVFHKIPEFGKNNYKDLEIGSFKTELELNYLYDQWLKYPNVIEKNARLLFEYLCTTKEVQKSYSKFLKNMELKKGMDN